MRKAKLNLLVFLLTLLISCDPAKKALNNSPEILPGFTLLPAPNSLDKPGTIFAIDKTGIKQPIGTLSLTSKSGIMVPGQATGKKSSSVAAVLNFLTPNNTNITANAASDVKRELTYKISLENCSNERIELLSISEELNKTKDLIKKFSQSNDLKNYKFYLITESVKASKLNYSFDTEKNGSIELKADFNKIINANPQVKWDNENSFLLSYDLQEPLYVYAKYWMLNIEAQGTGDTKFSMGEELKASDPIYVK
ncbi:MAG: hypothetical protein IPJ79_06305 [Bacteroidetes bacterium]|nr:hypothetical protein [Bacteroidota bacterium]